VPLECGGPSSRVRRGMEGQGGAVGSKMVIP
jgi:hypothetical protein